MVRLQHKFLLDLRMPIRQASTIVLLKPLLVYLRLQQPLQEVE